MHKLRDELGLRPLTVTSRPPLETEIGKKNISGVVTANLFNFLGSGLRLAREYSAKSGAQLIKFN
jgi:hypothetical protein